MVVGLSAVQGWIRAGWLVGTTRAERNRQQKRRVNTAKPAFMLLRRASYRKIRTRQETQRHGPSRRATRRQEKGLPNVINRNGRTHPLNTPRVLVQIIRFFDPLGPIIWTKTSGGGGNISAPDVTL
jgi:hypothetical protein